MPITHIAFYLRKPVGERSEGHATHTFMFLASGKSVLPGRIIPASMYEEESPVEEKRVSILEIPRGHRDRLKELARESDELHLGSISYAVDFRSKVAETQGYFPLEVLPLEGRDDLGRGSGRKTGRRQAPGLSYFLEHACTQNLGESITHVMTPSDSSPARKAHVERVGLPVGVPVPREEWVAGMERGKKGEFIKR